MIVRTFWKCCPCCDRAGGTMYCKIGHTAPCNRCPEGQDTYMVPPPVAT